jgi:protein-L-isoaspartate(D-aspartate) O-methyltransferase
MHGSREQGMQRMLADIRAEVAYTARLIGKDAFDPRVMDAMARVPRDEFVPDGLKSAAFANGPLPIGHGQTISQPYIVALMTDLLETQPDHRVLEIGTGSGYQTAVLSLLCDKVYSMDLIPALTEDAAARLARLGYRNVETRSGNGYRGWAEHAPYDGIIVTAAAGHIPEALVEQLRPGGRLVIPVGLPFMAQELMLLTKDAQGRTDTRSILGVAFVPLIDRSGPE